MTMTWAASPNQSRKSMTRTHTEIDADLARWAETAGRIGKAIEGLTQDPAFLRLEGPGPTRRFDWRDQGPRRGGGGRRRRATMDALSQPGQVARQGGGSATLVQFLRTQRAVREDRRDPDRASRIAGERADRSRANEAHRDARPASDAGRGSRHRADRVRLCPRNGASGGAGLGAIGGSRVFAPRHPCSGGPGRRARLHASFVPRRSLRVDCLGGDEQRRRSDRCRQCAPANLDTDRESRSRARVGGGRSGECHNVSPRGGDPPWGRSPSGSARRLAFAQTGWRRSGTRAGGSDSDSPTDDVARDARQDRCPPANVGGDDRKDAVQTSGRIPTTSALFVAARMAMARVLISDAPGKNVQPHGLDELQQAA
jgi:hypothetical protein